MSEENDDQFVTDEAGPDSSASTPAQGWSIPAAPEESPVQAGVFGAYGTPQMPEPATTPEPATVTLESQAAAPEPATASEPATAGEPEPSVEPALAISDAEEVVSPFAAAPPPNGAPFRATATAPEPTPLDPSSFAPPTATQSADIISPYPQAAQDIAAADAHAQAVAQAAAWEQANRARTGVSEDAAYQASAREDRNRQLGTVTPPADGFQVPTQHKSDTDRWLGSIGLLFLRVITAGILGVRAVQIFLHRSEATAYLESYDAPSPAVLAWVESGVLLLVALLLLVGFGTRAAAFVLTALAIASIVFVQWGDFSVIRDGINGLYGELQLLLAGVGITLLTLGSGGWAIDGFRRSAKVRNPAALME